MMSAAIAADITGVVSGVAKLRGANLQQAETVAGLNDTLAALRTTDGEKSDKPSETA